MIKKYRVNVNGTNYEVEVEEMTGAAVSAPAAAPARAAAPAPARAAVPAPAPAAAPAALKGSLGYLRTRFQKLPAAPAVSRRPSRGRYPEPCRHALCESGHQEPRG